MQDPAALAELVRRQDPAVARRRVDDLLAATPEEPAVLDLHSELCLRERRPREALRAVRRALELGGENSERYDRLGRCLNNLGRLEESERALRRAIDLRPGDADALARLGHVLSRLRRVEEAETVLSSAVELDPGHTAALKTLGMLRLAAGRHEDAAEFFRRAASAAPEDSGLTALTGVALHRSGDLAGAEAAYRRALEVDRSDANTWMNLGITLQDAGRLEEALPAYRTAVDLAPSGAAPRHRLAEALLAAGHAAEALEVIDQALSLDGGDPTGIAIRIAALQALGRGMEAERLLGLETLVTALDPGAPPGYRDIRQFNNALARHVLEHPTLTFEPEGHATRRGRHTKDLLAGEKGPIASLEALVLDAVEDYLSAVRPPEGHPFPGTVPRPHRLTMWAVVMDTEGHQLPHIHPAAWLSGVYYVELPETLGSGGDDTSGWIEFGLAPDELRGPADTPVKLFPPAEGRLYLFPSFLYHRTIPFGGAARRISIAFDLLRRAAA